ncbi:MAG: carbonic anhydrase [Pseudomonadota bacterium]
MRHAKMLPNYLVTRYLGWQATSFAQNKAWYERLAEEGQRPRAMIIACCDSRVQVQSIFGADQGELFIHRNIANLVPRFEPDGRPHGTSAAVEYAVTALRVANIVVVGHSNCGGVRGCYEMCEGQAPALEEESSFLGRWMDILREGYEQVQTAETEVDKIRALEYQSVIVSLNNLMTFPFVEQAVAEDKLSLHGVWHDIGSGALHCLDPVSGRFEPLQVH